MFTTYTILKFIHVTGAIIWVGGISTLTLLYTQLSRLEERPTLAALLKTSSFVGRIVVGPAAVLALLAGIATAASVGMDFGMLWLTWGFMGFLLSIVWGATFVRWTMAALQKSASSAGEAGVGAKLRLQQLQRRLTFANVVNLLILLSTVAAMVLKPTL